MQIFIVFSIAQIILCFSSAIDLRVPLEKKEQPISTSHKLLWRTVRIFGLILFSVIALVY